MLETPLSYGKEVKSSHLECELYYKDTAGAMEDIKETLKIKDLLKDMSIVRTTKPLT